MARKAIEVEALRHEAATRRNTPTAEFESVMREADKTPIRLAYERRNRDLDPQLVWRGKDEQDWSELIVSAPPLYIQEKVHPKVIIDDLRRMSRRPSLRGGTADEAIQGGLSRPFGARNDEPRRFAPRDDGKAWAEWEIPREADAKWPAAAKEAHARWWEARIARQKEIDASIAAKAEFEYLYDKPYVDGSRIRVAGPFTVESLSPHRTLAVDWDDELIDVLEAAEGKRRPWSLRPRGEADAGSNPDAGTEGWMASSRVASLGARRNDGSHDFAQMILENLKTAGVQQAHKEERITFTSLTGWPGHFICAEGTFMEGERQRRSA